MEKLRAHINFDFDPEHKLIGDRPLYNNFFVIAVKNLRAHLFMNCEAASIYEHRARIEESGYEICFHDYDDLMVAARIGKNGSVRQISGYKTDPACFMGNLGNLCGLQLLTDTLKKEEEDLTRGIMSTQRICVYHVGQDNISRAAALCDEIIAAMC